MPCADARVLCLEASGLETALAVAGHLGAPLIVHRNLKPSAAHEARSDFAGAIRECFTAGLPVVGVCAAGILVRSLAPVLRDKRTEPPVICVAEDGSSVIPLLGGHHGGNELAEGIAGALSAHAAITTASELRLGVALDRPPDGWRLENPKDAKGVAAAILAGRPTTISGGSGWLEPLGDLENVDLREAPDGNSPTVVQVTGAIRLICRRANLALGVGSVRNCPAGELIGLVRSTLADEGISAHEIEAVYSVDLKSDEAAVHALALDLGVEARFFPAERLELETDRLRNPSEHVLDAVGCHGVCEAAALAAAGPSGTLLVGKRKSNGATVAAARLGEPRGDAGTRRGRLALVGLGPGRPDLRTPEATRLLADADDLVGYSLYLDMVGHIANGKEIHGFNIGQEEERCRFALELAGTGRSVALVCSGDSGIYAMGALVMELLARGDGEGGVSAPARRTAIECAPGITAMQAAAARAGAVLGHDFCAISLSDLLTPREIILRRVRAAAQGDFVVGFYNPASGRRQSLIERSRDILLEFRRADTPVIIARNVGREGEQVTLMRLDELNSGALDMLSIVLVGSDASAAFASGDSSAGAGGRFVYTPRGYGPGGGGSE